MNRRFVKLLEIVCSGTGGRWGCPCCVGKRDKIANARAKRSARKRLKQLTKKESRT